MARVSFDRYRALPAINWSALKWMRESPLHYAYHLTAPDQDTASRMLGRLAHTLTLEPHRFDEDYAVWAEGDRRGNAWKAFAEANADRCIVKPNEIEAAQAMAAAVRAHPAVAPFLEGATFEDSIQWTDAATGLWCKARLDWHKAPVLLDLKSTTTIDERRFTSQLVKLGYDCQLAHYRNGLRANGIEIDEVVVVAVESKAPYDVAVFQLDDLLLDKGEAEVAALMQRVVECQASGAWPGRYPERQLLSLPDWILADTEITPTDEAA